MLTKIYVAATDDLKNKEVFDRLYARVRPERREKVDKMRFEEGRLLSLGVGALLMAALENEGFDYQNAPLVYGRNEKPDFPDGFKMHFNLSHSKERVMCVLSEKKIGCDVEQMRDHKMEIADRFFHDREVRLLKSLPPEEQRDMFYRLWTLKESYIKAIGEGLSQPLNSFCVMDENADVRLIHSAQDDGFVFRELDFSDGYKYAVCARGDDFEDWPVSVRFALL